MAKLTFLMCYVESLYGGEKSLGIMQMSDIVASSSEMMHEVLEDEMKNCLGIEKQLNKYK